MTIPTFTQRQLLEQSVERFGEDPRFFAFTCPTCGDVACPQDFIDRGADPQACGQECIGRSVGALAHGGGARDGGRSKAERGCDRAAYGLFSGPWKITFAGDGFAWSFPLATEAEAARAGVYARRDAAADTAADYVAIVRRQLAAYDLADANERIPQDGGETA